MDLLTHHLRTETSEPLLRDLLVVVVFFFFLSWKKVGREKRDRVPRESVQRKTKQNEKNEIKALKGGERKICSLFLVCMQTEGCQGSREGRAS